MGIPRRSLSTEPGVFFGRSQAGILRCCDFFCRIVYGGKLNAKKITPLLPDFQSSRPRE